MCKNVERYVSVLFHCMHYFVLIHHINVATKNGLYIMLHNSVDSLLILLRVSPSFMDISKDLAKLISPTIHLSLYPSPEKVMELEMFRAGLSNSNTHWAKSQN
ncbi:hypothetical protein XENOCAPTIV_007067 [Xenoophorus captivus]|uniref:Uncharacterized protein n=1 Tax=Xenoophorus captivus TaxID=1517983 RepID=A0ABV0SDR4_9TELE